MKPHVKEYHQLLDEYFALSKKTELRDKQSPNRRRMDKISERLNEIRSSAEKHIITCTKSCYVGQGMSYEPGDVVQSYIDEEEAKEHLARIDKDSWGAGCFRIECKF